MDVKPYINPFEEGSGDKVEEPVAVSTSSAHQLDALRHQVMDAVASSDDKVTLVLCLHMLTHQRKHRRIHCAGKSDAELAATLSATTDWDDTDHADLSQIDYQKYKPYRSPKVQKTIEKWL